MGLDIGIRVKRQIEGFMCTGSNPKGTSEEIEERLWELLSTRFPDSDGCFGVDVTDGKQEYTFSVSFFHYGDTFLKKGFTFDAMYLALTEFVLSNFSEVDGIEMLIYFSA